MQLRLLLAAALFPLLVLPCLAGGSASGASAPTRAGTGSLLGTVVDGGDGRALRDISVFAWTDDGASWRTRTDDEGRFDLAGVDSDVELHLTFFDRKWAQYEGTVLPEVVTLTSGEQRDLGTVGLDDGMNLRRSPSALDVSDRREVVRSWKQDVRLSARTPSPAIHGCTVARQPERVLRKVARVINWYRGMAGLDPVVLDPRLNRLAQRSSVIQSYLRSEPLSHDPPASTRCWTRAGADAAGSSNLAMGWTGGRAVIAYVSDYGEPSVGHRRPILNPTATAFGSGDAGRYNSIYVYGPSSQKASRPPWVAWPSAGYFPYGETPSTWSLQTPRADVDLRGARASLTVSTGQRIRAVDQKGDTSTLLWTLSTPPRRPHDLTRVDVEVSGIKWRGVVQPPLVYSVRILDLLW